MYSTIGIILLGQEALGGVLDNPKNREVDSRVERIPLTSILSAEEAKTYITHLASVKGIKLNGAIDDTVYEVIAKRHSSFLGINNIMREAVEMAISIRAKTLTEAAFRNI